MSKICKWWILISKVSSRSSSIHPSWKSGRIWHTHLLSWACLNPSLSPSVQLLVRDHLHHKLLIIILKYTRTKRLASSKRNSCIYSKYKMSVLHKSWNQTKNYLIMLLNQKLLRNFYFWNRRRIWPKYWTIQSRKARARRNIWQPLLTTICTQTEVKCWSVQKQWFLFLICRCLK